VRGGLVTPKRLAVLAGCLAVLAACCGLAWWQWSRFESASGTFQNLGYVFQWPLFGLFPAFMVWRMRRLRRAQAGTEPSADDATPVVPAPREVVRPKPRPAPVAEPLDEADEELAVYNRYLAELHEAELHEKGNSR
jgi:hypothetical protein